MADTQHKTFKFEIKKLTEQGTFSGYANVTEIRDQGGDIVKRGAFKRTIKALKGKVPLFGFHDPGHVVGVGFIEEDDRGLKVNEGRLNLDTERGRDMYADLRFFADHKMAMEMSIGYQAVKWKYEGQDRVLQEVKLKEVSLLPPGYAMNQRSRVQRVKDDADVPPQPPPDDDDKTDTTPADAGFFDAQKLDAIEAQQKEILYRLASLQGLEDEHAPDPQPKHSDADDTKGADCDPRPDEHSQDMDALAEKQRELTARIKALKI